MDEELNKNLNENNNQEKNMEKEGIDETLESVTADKTGRIQRNDANKDSQEQALPDRAIVIEEFKKFLTSPEHRKSQQLIANMNSNLGQLFAKTCTKDFLSMFRPGQETLVAQELMSNLTVAGFMKSFADKIKSGEKEKDGLDPKKILQFSDSEVDENFYNVATNQGLNENSLRDNNTALYLNGNSVEGIRADDDSIKSIIEKFLFVVVELANDEFSVARPHIPNISKEAQDKLKRACENAMKAQGEASHSNKKDVMETEERNGYDTQTTNNNLDENKDKTIRRESLNHSKALNKVVDASVDKALKDGTTADREAVGPAKRLEEDYLDKTPGLLQEQADREAVNEMTNDEHNNRDDKIQR